MKTVRRLIICGTLLLGLQLNAQETQPTIVGMPGGIRVAPLSDDATACRGKVVNKDGNPVVGHPIILCQDILFPQFYFDHTDKNGEFTVRVNRSNYIAEIGGAGYQKMRFDLDMMRDYNFEQPLTLTYENGVESDISDLLKLKLHRHHYQMDITPDKRLKGKTLFDLLNYAPFFDLWSEDPKVMLNPRYKISLNGQPINANSERLKSVFQSVEAENVKRIKVTTASIFQELPTLVEITTVDK